MSGRDASALVECAAKLMHEDAIEDVGEALRRATRMLGRTNTRLPQAEDVRAALLRRLRLFSADSDQVLLEMRKAALDAMEFLAEFKPRAIGSVIDGTAQLSDRIKLLCECDPPDRLDERLQELRIPAQQLQRFVAGELQQSFEFIAGKFAFELIAQAPRKPQRAALCANAAQLRRLIASGV